MTLILILICLLIEHFLGTLEAVRQLGWYHTYIIWTTASLERFRWWHGPLGVLLLVLIPVMLLYLIYNTLHELTLGLGTLFSLGTLIYCLGPRDLTTQIYAYLDAVKIGDQVRANMVAEELVGVKGLADSPRRAQSVVEAVLVQANQRLFAVLFWFTVMGPVGAFLYRLTAEMRTRPDVHSPRFMEAADDLLALLNWIPARLTALGYAVSGSLTHALEAWRFRDTIALHANEAVLEEAGLGALQFDRGVEPEEENEVRLVTEARGLVGRTLLVWLTVLAIMTLAGWAT